MGGAPSEVADVEALGALLYEMLTGRAPWAAEPVGAAFDARLAGPPPPPSTLNPAVPVALDEITMRALSPAPNSRYGSACEVADALEAFVYPGSAAGDMNRAAGASATAPRDPCSCWRPIRQGFRKVWA